MNPQTGNCIIPSKDIPSANIGNLRDKGTQIFYYNMGEGQEPIIASSGNLNAENNGKLPKKYMQDGYTVYAYNYNNDVDTTNYDRYDIPPFSYVYNRINNSSDEKNNLMENVIIKGNEIDFNNIGWSQYKAGIVKGPSICKIKDWIVTNQIYWDGLTNYNKC
jgi:hypothetical protein